MKTHHNTRRTLPLALLITALFFASYPARGDDGVTLQMDNLGADVYMFSGVGGFAGGNVTALIGEDGVLLVDAALEPTVPKILAALSSLSDQPVRFVINTHAHADHTEGNALLSQTATIVAHEGTRADLLGPDVFFGENGDIPVPVQALPVLTYNDNLSLYFNEQHVAVAHMQDGHTNGDSIISFPQANVICLGDNFFNGMYPFLGNGGGVRGIIALLEAVAADLQDDVDIVPGHGPLASKKDLLQYIDMLRETSAIVETAIANGLSVEQMQEASILEAYDAHWGQGYQTSSGFIASLNHSLLKKT